MNLQIDIKMHTKILREKNNIVSYTINVFPINLWFTTNILIIINICWIDTFTAALDIQIKNIKISIKHLIEYKQ